MRTYMSIAVITSALCLSACGGQKEDVPASSSSAPGAPAAAPESSGGGIALTKEQAFANTYLSELSQIADVMETVNDEESAKQAAAVISSASVKIEALKNSYGDDISGPQAMMIFMPRQQEFIAVQQRIAVSMTSIAQTHPQFLQTVSEAMQDMPAMGN